MSWYSASWKYRAPISLYQAAATTPIDVVAPIPVDFEHFWANVLANGNDVRVTSANGRTLVSYDLAAGWDVATLTGILELDNVTVAISGKTTLFWLYYGNAAGADARSAVAPSTPVTGTIAKDAPRSFVVPVAMEKPGALKPVKELAKKSTENVDIYFEITDFLVRRSNSFAGSDRYEEVASFVASATTGGADATNTVIDKTLVRYVEWGDRGFVVVPVTGGTDAIDYTIVATITTVELEKARVVSARCLMKVRDVDDA